jgi:hypothetical protein
MTQQSNGYNSKEHLIQIKGKDGQVKDYLPANWRLHELRVTYPTATIESEIVHMDVEHNLVIVKAWIFDGATYAESSHRASSFKQGLLSALDKVETAAKSRAARDFGIGTEFALEAEPEEDLGQEDGNAPTVTLEEIKDAVKSLGLVRNPQQWQVWKRQTLKKDIPDEKLTVPHLRKMRMEVLRLTNEAA